MKLLVATDGSATANLAIDLLAARPQPTADLAHVVSAVPPGPLLGSELEPLAGFGKADALTDIAAAIVADAVARLEASGYQASGEVRLGNPPELICEIVAQEGDQIAVVGARGVGRLRRFIVGSVAARVAREATSSVLVVRESTQVSPAVIATDGSSVAENAARWYRSLIAGMPAKIIALQVNQEGSIDATARIAALFASVPNVVVEERQLTGNETDVILSTAAESLSAMIVLGAKRHVYEDQRYLGTTANAVLHQANASVLIGR